MGYVFALNWSLYGAIILPIILVFCLRVRGAMRSTLASLANHGLLRTEDDFGRVSQADALNRWQRLQTPEIVLISIVGAAVLGYAVYNWWEVVGGPLLGQSPLPGAPLSHPTMEYDWSISSLFPGSEVATGPLFAFGLIAYLVIPGLGSVVAFATFISAMHFLAMTSGLITPKHERRWKLAVKPDANDSLLGFGHFAPLFSNLASAAVAIIFGLLIMMVQNNYLRSAAQPDIFAFLIGDGSQLVSMFNQSPLKWKDAFLDYFFAPSLLIKRNAEMGVGLLIYAFVFASSFAACWAILRASARSAASWSTANQRVLAVETGRPEAEIEQEIGAMKYWPIGWISLNQLLFLMIFLLAAVFSYRLALIPAVWVLFKSFKTVRQMASDMWPKTPKLPMAGKAGT